MFTEHSILHDLFTIESIGKPQGGLNNFEHNSTFLVIVLKCICCLSGLFLLVGLGIYGDRTGNFASPNSMLLGTVSMFFIFASFGLGVFSFLISYGPKIKKSENNNTEASEPTTFTG